MGRGPWALSAARALSGPPSARPRGPGPGPRDPNLDNFNKNLKVYDSLESVVKDKTFVIEAVVERFDVKKDIFGHYQCRSVSGKYNHKKSPVCWAKELENLGAGAGCVTPSISMNVLRATL